MKGCGVYMIENPVGQIYIGASKNLENRHYSYTKGVCYSNRPMDKQRGICTQTLKAHYSK